MFLAYWCQDKLEMVEVHGASVSQKARRRRSSKQNGLCFPQFPICRLTAVRPVKRGIKLSESRLAILAARRSTLLSQPHVDKDTSTQFGENLMKFLVTALIVKPATDAPKDVVASATFTYVNAGEQTPLVNL